MIKLYCKHFGISLYSTNLPKIYSDLIAQIVCKRIRGPTDLSRFDLRNQTIKLGTHGMFYGIMLDFGHEKLKLGDQGISQVDIKETGHKILKKFYA